MIMFKRSLYVYYLCTIYYKLSQENYNNMDQHMFLGTDWGTSGGNAAGTWTATAGHSQTCQDCISSVIKVF